MSVENIAKKILDDAQADARSITEKAEREAARLALELDREEKEIREAANRRIEIETREVVERRTSSARLEGRKRILREKEMIMAEVYAQVRERILALPEDKCLDFLKRLAMAHITGGDGKVMLSANDLARFKKRLPEWEKDVAREAKNRRKAGSINVSSETRDIEGGFILSQGRTEVNLSLAVILEETKYELEGEVTRILFGP